MTEQQPPYNTRKSGAGRKPMKKLKLFHKLQTIFSPVDYERLLKYKEATGRTLQDIGNSAVMEYINGGLGMGEK